MSLFKVTGAALFGARGTGAFVSRKARLTYGVRGSRRFDHNDADHVCREEVSWLNHHCRSVCHVRYLRTYSCCILRISYWHCVLWGSCGPLICTTGCNPIVPYSHVPHLQTFCIFSGGCWGRFPAAGVCAKFCVLPTVCVLGLGACVRVCALNFLLFCAMFMCVCLVSCVVVVAIVVIVVSSKRWCWGTGAACFTTSVLWWRREGTCLSDTSWRSPSCLCTRHR